MTGRYGANPLHEPIPDNIKKSPGIEIVGMPVLCPEDSQNTRVLIKLMSLYGKEYPDLRRPLVYVGGKVFGLSDAPVRKVDLTGYTGDFSSCRPPNKLPEPQRLSDKAPLHTMVSFIAPTQLLRSTRMLTVMDPFRGPDYMDNTPINSEDVFIATSLTLLAVDKEARHLAVAGSNFVEESVEVTVGKETFRSDKHSKYKVGDPKLEFSSSSLLIVSPKVTTITGVKQVVVAQQGKQPVMLSVPPLPSSAVEVKAPVLAKHVPLVEGDVYDIRVDGESLDSIEEVHFEGLKLKFTPAEKGMSMMLQVPSAITQKPGQKQLTLVLKDGTLFRNENWKLIVAPKT